MDQDHIDLAVLYPTMLLGLQSVRDVDFAEAQARAYNDWCSDHVPGGRGPPVRRGRGPADARARRRRPRRRRDPSGRRRCRAWCRCSCGRTRSIDWRPFNDPVYDPIWQAAADTGLPIALHPFLVADLPGACVGLRLSRPREPDGSYVDDFDPERQTTERGVRASGAARDSMLFTQAIANPVDVMSCIAFLLRRRRVRALPRRQVHLPGGQRRLARAVARAPRPPLPQVPVGGRPTCRCCRRSTSAGSAGSASTPTRRCSRITARVAAGRCRPHHLGVGLPAPRRQVPRRHRGADRGARRPELRARSGQITSESALALYGIG